MSDLIIFIQKNLKSENYIFITTHEIFSGQKDNFTIFCKKIPLNYVVECFIEKTEKSFKSGMVIFKIKKEYILEKELASFELVKEENNPTNLIPIRNNFDYEYSKHNTSNQNEIGWFLRKIFGSKAKMQDHYVKNIRSDNISTINVRDVATSSGLVDYDPPLPQDRPSSNFFVYQSQQHSLRHEIEKQKLCLLTAIKLESDNFFIHNQLGMFYFENRSYFRAMECFQTSQEINPQFSYNKKMLSHCYFALEKTSLAIFELEQINFEKQPDMEKLDMELSLAIYKTFTQDYTEAIIHFEELHNKYKNASQIWPDFIPSLFVNWINCLKQDSKIDDEIRVLKLALNETPSSFHHTPTYGMFVHDLALLFFQSNQIDNAIDICNNGLSKNKGIWPVLGLLALCYMSKNEPENALSNLSLAKSFLEKEPPHLIDYAILKDYTNFIEIIKLGLDEIKSKEITENLIKISKSQIESEWELMLKKMGATTLTNNSAKNDQIAITKLNECKTYLFWIDPYFDAPGFKWICEAYVQKNSSIKKIEILAKFQGHDPKKEFYQPKFKEDFDKLKNELNEKNITLEFRICSESKYAKKIHARFWYFFENQPPVLQSAWNIPSVMNFKKGTKDSINPTTQLILMKHGNIF